MGRFYGLVAERMLPRVADCSTIFDYVNGSQAERLDFKGDVSQILFRFGMQKVNPESATQMCCNYAQEGSALGAIYPGHFKRLFEETYKKRDEDTWQLFRASGLDLPEQQDVMRYDEVEQVEAQTFLAYCEEFAPSLYVSLSSA